MVISVAKDMQGVLWILVNAAGYKVITEVIVSQ
jgi:hypothetical protein